MKTKKYLPLYSEGSGLRPGEFPDFEAVFQRSVLFALLQRKQLTREQYEKCVERLVPKPGRGG